MEGTQIEYAGVDMADHSIGSPSSFTFFKVQMYQGESSA